MRSVLLACVLLLDVVAPVSSVTAPSSTRSSNSLYFVNIPSSSAVGSSTPTPTSTLVSPTSTVNASILQDIETIHKRRLDSIVGALNFSQVPQISTWLATLVPSGEWPDVDYTTGCAAQRANWPAQNHWLRLQLMAAAWHGGLPGADTFVKQQKIRDSLSLAMDYWFSRDFVNPDCLDSGGTSLCPCTNPDDTLWNTNWFSNVILIPNLVGQTCLLLNESLTIPQFNNCTRITGRSYDAFQRSQATYLTGANILDVSKIGIDGGLLSINVTQLTDAFGRVHQEVTVKDVVRADGIRPDGTFGQHSGILYNGNYGKDYANDALDFEIETSGTQFTAGAETRSALETLFDADRWMIYRNVLTGVNHWDFSVLGRFIAFTAADDVQATSSIKINLTEVEALGEQWSSSTLIDFGKKLSENASNANAGFLTGNRMFYDNDYMVHRGRDYVSTLKMYSSRTQNTECINLANPFGFHLSDGALHTYLIGNEYEDIAASWDWNLIPGITVDYGATELNCSYTRVIGIENFVGGASDGSVGLGVMRYTNPLTKSLHWQKAWFFLPDDIQHVMISDVSSTSGAPVLSVLDQRLHNGPTLVDGTTYGATETLNTTIINARSVWHGGVGYVIDDPELLTLSLEVGPKTGNWSTIGTSTQPPYTMDLYTAWLEHQDFFQPVAYTAFPGTTLDEFQTKASLSQLETISNDGQVSAVYDSNKKIAMAAFWQPLGGIITFTPCEGWASITILADSNIVIIYRVDTGSITVADPSQTLDTVDIVFIVSPIGWSSPNWRSGLVETITIALPSGGLAGSSVTQNIWL